jgi:16S rRNA (adenine1518-N6/adenine1519-N6)-dimethyltransferase
VSAAAVKALLERHGLLARKDLGQNFLVDETLAARLVTLAGVVAGDWVIEIGAGLGALTHALAARAERVISFEIDAGIVRALRAEGNLPDHVELIHADALRADLRAVAERAPRPPRLVSNLPYHISAPLLRRLLDLRDTLTDWSVMLQAEVAKRLLAAPGSRDYGSLSVLHRLTVAFSKEMDLSPNCFYPVPGVHSTFVRMVPLEHPGIGPDELAPVERIVRAAFAKRRKTIQNSLRAAGIGEACAGSLEAALMRSGVDPRARAESLEPEALLAVARSLRATP